MHQPGRNISTWWVVIGVFSHSAILKRNACENTLRDISKRSGKNEWSLSAVNSQKNHLFRHKYWLNIDVTCGWVGNLNPAAKFVRPPIKRLRNRAFTVALLRLAFKRLTNRAFTVALLRSAFKRLRNRAFSEAFLRPAVEWGGIRAFTEALLRPAAAWAGIRAFTEVLLRSAVEKAGTRALTEALLRSAVEWAGIRAFTEALLRSAVKRAGFRELRLSAANGDERILKDYNYYFSMWK